MPRFVSVFLLVLVTIVAVVITMSGSSTLMAEEASIVANGATSNKGPHDGTAESSTMHGAAPSSSSDSPIIRDESYEQQLNRNPFRHKPQHLVDDSHRSASHHGSDSNNDNTDPLVEEKNTLFENEDDGAVLLEDQEEYSVIEIERILARRDSEG